MKASENHFIFIANEQAIEIPFFQRAYVWKEEQWGQLFEDLSDSFRSKKAHFLGSIILKQLQTQAGEGSKRSLIDGQQRLTIFSILVKSLYDRLDGDDKRDYEGYLFRKPIKDKIPRIKHSKIDSIAFNEILKAENFESLKGSKNKDSLLIKCYEYFSSQICELENHKKFLDFIIESKLWVAINIEKDEDEQKIFDSINTAGIKLTATDIIKNALFDKAMQFDENEAKQWYSGYWESIFESEKNIKFWSQESATGRLKRTQSEIFLHAFAIIKGIFDANTSLEHLSERYKEYIKDFGKEKLEKFLSQIKEYAKIYLAFPKIKNDTNLSFENYEFRLFHILQIADISTVMPLLLKLKFLQSAAKISEADLKNCFELLEICLISHYICKRATRDYNKIFYKITQEINENDPAKFIKEFLSKADEKGQKYMSSKNDIELALSSIKENKRARLILFWIELFRRYQNKGQDIVELSYSPYTLEHLMPQKWEQNWSEIGKDKENAEKLIFQIGNMTLLTGSLNSTMKNETWQRKLGDKNEKMNCIRKCADLLITRDLLDKKEWNETTIAHRTEQLTKEFFEIWDINKF